jgi:hypothetical protein
MQLLRRRYPTSTIALISAGAVALHLALYVTAFVRLVFWETIRPIHWLWDGSVMILTNASLIVAIIAWFWVADASFWLRSLYAIASFLIIFVLFVPVSMALRFIWAILTGI